MPATATKTRVRDTGPATAKRVRNARERRIVAGIAEAFRHGWTVDAAGYVRDDKDVVKARLNTH